MGYLNSVNLNNTFVAINFTNSIIDNFPEYDLENRLTGFKEVKSKFSLGKFYIYLTIAGKEEKLLFDTGNAGSIILSNDSKDFITKNVFETFGNNYSSFNKNILGKNKCYINEPIKMGNDNYITNINYSSSISNNNLGIKFIKAFDWILDFKSKKVYYKKNNIEIDNKFQLYEYASFTTNNKLYVFLKEKSQLKYNIGDQIISVNAQKVTLDNICDMQILLNKTENWDSLNLEVAPITK